MTRDYICAQLVNRFGDDWAPPTNVEIMEILARGVHQLEVDKTRAISEISLDLGIYPESEKQFRELRAWKKGDAIPQWIHAANLQRAVEQYERRLRTYKRRVEIYEEELKKQEEVVKKAEERLQAAEEEKQRAEKNYNGEKTPLSTRANGMMT